MAKEFKRIQIDPNEDLTVSLEAYSDSDTDREKKALAELKIKLLKNIQKSQRANTVDKGEYRTTINGDNYVVNITNPITFVDPISASKSDQQNLTRFLNNHKNKTLLLDWLAFTKNDIEKNKIYVGETDGNTYYYFLTRPVNLLGNEYHAEGKKLGSGAFGEARPSYKLMLNEFSKLYHPQKVSDTVSKTIKIQPITIHEGDESFADEIKEQAFMDIVSEEAITAAYHQLTASSLYTQTFVRGKETTKAVILTQRAPGITLKELLANKDIQLSDREKLLIAKKITEAVEKLHQTKITHGDIKNDNILIDMIGDTFYVTIIDFGGSRMNSPNFRDEVHTDNFLLANTLQSLYPHDATISNEQHAQGSIAQQFNTIIEDLKKRDVINNSSSNKDEVSKRTKLNITKSKLANLELMIHHDNDKNISPKDNIAETNRRLQNISTYAKLLSTRGFKSEFDVIEAIRITLIQGIQACRGIADLKELLYSTNDKAMTELADKHNVTKNMVLEHIFHLTEACLKEKQKLLIEKAKQEEYRPIAFSMPGLNNVLDKMQAEIKSADIALASITKISDIADATQKANNHLKEAATLGKTNLDVSVNRKISAFAGIKTYLKNNKSRLYRITHFIFTSTGTKRAENYLELLRKSNSDANNLLILYALLSDENGGTNLRRFVSNALKYDNINAAIADLRTKIIENYPKDAETQKIQIEKLTKSVKDIRKLANSKDMAEELKKTSLENEVLIKDENPSPPASSKSF